VRGPEQNGRGELTTQVLAAEQDERRRIALFLHDGPVQSLSGVALMLDAVSDFIERGRSAEAREILQLLADGMSNADVATKLFISQETVKSHVRHILAKLEADTRTHAVAIALRESIID
jgi:DNA-binding CsgD family transcriptional regulator